MIELAKKIRDMYVAQNNDDKNFLGGIPFTEEILRQIKNYELFLQNEIDRSRINVGKVLLNDFMNPIAYSTFTIFQNANPTKYEKEFIGLNEKLNYFQFKSLLVDRNYRGKGIGDELIKYRLNLAKQFQKNSICDVKEENKKIIFLLERNNFKKLFEWETPSKSKMVRYFHL